jgi:hypothetical protein
LRPCSASDTSGGLLVATGSNRAGAMKQALGAAPIGALAAGVPERISVEP